MSSKTGKSARSRPSLRLALLLGLGLAVTATAFDAHPVAAQSSTAVMGAAALSKQKREHRERIDGFEQAARSQTGNGHLQYCLDAQNTSLPAIRDANSRTNRSTSKDIEHCFNWRMMIGRYTAETDRAAIQHGWHQDGNLPGPVTARAPCQRDTGIIAGSDEVIGPQLDGFQDCIKQAGFNDGYTAEWRALEDASDNRRKMVFAGILGAIGLIGGGIMLAGRRRQSGPRF